MRFMRATAGYTHWDHKRNYGIMKELQIQPIKQFIDKYQLQWGKTGTTNESTHNS